MRLNRKSRSTRRGGKCPAGDGVIDLARLIEKAHGPRYSGTDALEFFLRNKAPVMFSNNTDAFSQLEAEFGVTYEYLSVFAEIDQPLMILTKGSGWNLLDQDRYLELLRRFSRVFVGVTITADNDICRAEWEPNAATIDDRFRLVESLTQAGIPAYVHCVPFIPERSFIERSIICDWDDPQTYLPFLERVAASGAYGVTVAPLVFDRSDGKALSAHERLYVADMSWMNSENDLRWRVFVPEVSIWTEISQIWYSEAKRLGLQCGVWQPVHSLVADIGDLDCLVCGPPWLDRSASWVNAVSALRNIQQQSGLPVVTSTAEIASFIASAIPWSDHVFRWPSWRTCVPKPLLDESYRAQLEGMPEHVTVEDVLLFQMNQICKWSDSVWSDIAVRPLYSREADALLESDMGNLLLVYDNRNPRDAWAVVRSGMGDEGCVAEDLAEFVTVAARDGKLIAID